jgi:hypothetical protein
MEGKVFKMRPYVLVIDNYELVANIISDNLDAVIFDNPLVVNHKSPTEMSLELPQWLKLTPARSFTVDKSKITMILEPTPNLTKSYTGIISDLTNKNQEKENKE